MGRFNVVDRFAEKIQDQSPYQYGLNQPINNIDFNGDSVIRGAGFVRNVGQGFADGFSETKSLLSSLTTGRGWLKLGYGLSSLNPHNPLNSNTALADNLVSGVANIPNMTGDDWGHAVGYGTEKIGEAALISKGAGLAGNVARNGLSGLTTSKGFLLGSVSVTAPFDINVGLYASENTMSRGAFQFSRIAPSSLGGTEEFGRRMLQITNDFQPTLGQWSNQVIPAGTKMQLGLVGPQKGAPLGSWLQIYTPKPVPFIKP